MNVCMVVAYDGTDFRGLAPNPGVRTVVGELERVIEPLIGVKPDIVMSGRTDAGVHAQGQVLSFTMPAGAAELERIQRSVNSRLGPEVIVQTITEAPADFSARFSATGRRYRYLVINRPVDDPFLSRTGWWVDSGQRGSLDIEAMNAACVHLIGEHDFSSFCRRPKPRPSDTGSLEEVSLVRRVDGARWLDLGDDLLRFDIRGSAFCHQMVRSIVGFMVAVGSGKRRADELPEVLAARDRSVAENPAPPHGLTLWQVDYESTMTGDPADGGPDQSAPANDERDRRYSTPLGTHDPDDIAEFWRGYLEAAGLEPATPAPEPWCFGDTAELADELIGLVVDGPKRATAGALDVYEIEELAVPAVGDLSIVMDGSMRPRAVLMTTDVRIGPLSSVDDQFAWDEGEGDRTRTSWLDAHHWFFTRQYDEHGLRFDADIPVVFERFDIVYRGDQPIS